MPQPTSKARLVLTALFVDHQTPAEVAARYGVHRAWVYKLKARYEAEGEAALEPRSRRPKTSPAALSPEVVDLTLRLRKKLTDAGLDAGPETIAWHLEHHHGHRVSRSTISRQVTRAGLVTPEPKKRPKSSYIRFQAAMPNETCSPTSPTTGSPTPTADPARTSRSSPGSTTAPATPCMSPRTPGSPPRSWSRRSAKPLPGTGSPPPRSPTTAWSTPSDWPATAAKGARTPSKPNSAAATSPRRTPDPGTPPPAAKPSDSSRP